MKDRYTYILLFSNILALIVGLFSVAEPSHWTSTVLEAIDGLPEVKRSTLEHIVLQPVYQRSTFACMGIALNAIMACICLLGILDNRAKTKKKPGEGQP